MTPENAVAPAPAPAPFRLDSALIVATVERLRDRIDRRFPDSGLGRVCRALLEAARRADERTGWIARPVYWMRALSGALILLLGAAFAAAFAAVQWEARNPTVYEVVQLLESTINDIVFVGAAIFFLVTLERRVKRRRALDAIHELRSIAHVIDMHQLTKDPDKLAAGGADAPAPAMRSPENLGRYLDYCSEMLSLTSKTAALYVQGFDDEVALDAVNEVEALATGLSSKIWQKLSLIHAAPYAP